MFTQRFTAPPSAVGPPTVDTRQTEPLATAASTFRPAGTGASGEKSVIGNDLKIVGQGLKIISEGILQVDGEVEGDVQGAEVIVGAKGKVTGKVIGQKVDVCGAVAGVVCGNIVVLKSTSTVDGDIHHMSLSIENGAQFDGSSRHANTEAELVAAR